jgi:hypothetical protein
VRFFSNWIPFWNWNSNFYFGFGIGSHGVKLVLELEVGVQIRFWNWNWYFGVGIRFWSWNILGIFVVISSVRMVFSGPTVPAPHIFAPVSHLIRLVFQINWRLSWDVRLFPRLTYQLVI